MSTKKLFRAVVVAQLVEGLLPIPEVRCSNPVIGELLFIYSLSTVLKDEKEAGNGPFKKHKNFSYDSPSSDLLPTFLTKKTHGQSQSVTII